MADKNEVTISLEEYNKLLLRDKPNNKDKMLLERIKDLILESIMYDEDWSGKAKIEFRSDSRFTEELITTIKVIDKELYKEMIKHICDEKAKEDAENAQMKKTLEDINNN